MKPLTLWYEQPAADWNAALPVGNGRLGAMIFGGIAEERLQLNEDTVWAGGPYDPANPGGPAALREGQRLVFAGKAEEAGRLLHARFNGIPNRGMPYQPLGDLFLRFPFDPASATNYQRSLDLDTAVARTSYEIGGTTYTREVFSSAPDQVLVVRLTANQSRALNFRVALSTPLSDASLTASVDGITLDATSTDAHGIPGQVRAHAVLQVLNEHGTVRTEGNELVVSGAEAVTLLLATGTNYRGWNDLCGDAPSTVRAQLESAARKPFEALRRTHVADYETLFHRVSISLGEGVNSRLPTDERVRRSQGDDDPALASLFFQFGRYLLISSSRPGTRPANLQGIWNDLLQPPWGSKYTININLQMNYWPAEITNLSECHQPLLDMVRQMPEPGRRTAQIMYGAKRGWVAHHNTDAWLATAPIDANDAGIWPLGGAWLCLHLWEHYLYSGGEGYLAEIYPVLRGACEFQLETLIEHPRYGWLVTCPSNSPEHGGIVAGPTMDMAILRDLFEATAASASLLGVDAGFARELHAARERLAPYQIGRFGQLQEWLEDVDEEHNTHRHVSHLFGLHPSHQITAADTPELFDAARVSLDARGDAGTGWSLAWKINFWARLCDGERAHRLLLNQLSVPDPDRRSFDGSGGTYPNLFDAHPPFQIDGNFGATAGIAEMLLQSRARVVNPPGDQEAGIAFELTLLPALPRAWSTGHVFGLRSRGGFEVRVQWQKGQLVAATLQASRAAAVKVRYGPHAVDLTFAASGTVELGPKLETHE